MAAMWGGTPFHSSYGPGPGNGGWNKPNLAKSKEELLATEVLMWLVFFRDSGAITHVRWESNNTDFDGNFDGSPV